MQTPPPPLKSGQTLKNFMKDVECAEFHIIVKNNLKKSTIFIFRVIAKFHRKLGWWRHKNDHNLKNKNRKFGFSFYSVDSGSFIQILKRIIFFKVIKLTWKIRNRLNRKKNQISDFTNFYFLSNGHFCDVITQIFDEISR